MTGPIITTRKCAGCKEGVAQPFAFTMAFQPIVDVTNARVFAYEALVRGPNNEPAGTVLSQVNEENRYAFDQNCRVQAITLAARLGLAETGAKLSINFMPGAIYSPAACIQLTLETAQKVCFPLDALIFEVVESEKPKDHKHLSAIFKEYREHGFKMALDDFGAGYAGINLFLDLAPEVLKLDMDLTRALHTRPLALGFVRMMAGLCSTHGIDLVAEGVETLEEYEALRRCGVHLMQGYLLARPAFEKLSEFVLPECQARQVIAA
jgi:EAL domain-containing protein (putative c-di-GMP-specific phosphodiesterase class I)